ncbi:MAG TPA: 50S ribosomal protein L18 [Kosmotogaceae bacterium]|nr:MAG: 50S ribosomal protein L18 [Thermotogales bacterium 46_20]HAA85288.1 50S ribosomal protein L18 [Kosmotogaceae bacterium]
MMKRTDRKKLRIKRRLRVRSKVRGTSERPRLSVFRSDRHIYAQLIDDTVGDTIVSSSTVESVIRSKITKTWGQEAAKEVGKLLAERALEKGLKRVVFDRGGFKFHGRVKALADGAREAGLEF